MTSQAERWTPPLRIARGAGAVGFIVARWLLAVCNVPAACGPLAVVSSLAAALYVVAFLGSSSGLRSAVLGRFGARVLALTCAAHLARDVLNATLPVGFWSRIGLVEGLDMWAWVWAIGAGLAAARWLWGGLPAGGSTRPVAVRHLALSALIVLVIGLQVWVLVTTTRTLWPFIDYPLYGTSHGRPVRAVHHRLYGLTAQEPSAFLELTSEALGMSWFVYHTQFIPELFDAPSLVPDTFHRALEDSDVPPLRLLVAERKTFQLNDGYLDTFGEHRVVPLDDVRPR